MNYIGKIARENVFHFPGAIRNPKGVSYGYIKTAPKLAQFSFFASLF
jgi:hypothetical protein